MNHGTKANNLEWLRTAYPNNVPPFIIIPFDKIIANHAVHTRSIQKISNSFLSSKATLAQFQAKASDIARTVSINRAELKKLQSKLAESNWQHISIRTSALAEDGASSSFAGQYVTHIDVKSSDESLETYIRDCYTSLFSERVMTYAKTKQLKDFKIGGSVVIQQMFYGQKSGVLFSEDGTGSMLLNYAHSWRNTTVEGDDATSILLPKAQLDKSSRREFERLRIMALEIEQSFGAPVDIEWSISNKETMLLQVRPQTTETEPYRLNWDATNISENYPDVTLPLTYSFIKNLYANVYPSFFRLMGLPEQTLKQKSWVFENALGYIDGRIYYRIDNWYEIVKLIPGKDNEKFFEAMLNPVKHKSGAATKSKKRTIPSLNVLWLGIRFVLLLIRSPSLSKQFSKRFAHTYKEVNRLNWDAMTAEACLDHLHAMRARLLVLWGIPILNDIRVMVFHGIFKTILLKGADQKTYLESLSGFQDKASVKPLQALDALGKEIADYLNAENVTTIAELKTTSSWAAVVSSAETFVDTFGGRTPDELQLENPRIGESIPDVIALAFSSRNADLVVRTDAPTSGLNKFTFLKRIFARYIVGQMRSAISYRERFRFNRAQIFGVGRHVYLALGKKLVTAGALVAEEDIFWATEQEIENVVRGHAWEYDLRPIVSRRKKQHAAYLKKSLRMRVTGEGVIAPLATTDSTPVSKSTLLEGTGVAPGIITAPVIVVEAFDPELEVTGKILVVKHVDPGWTLLLVQAAGVISERGNSLSHVAIVSREIKIPAIVGVKDAVSMLTNDAVLTIDGTSGEIRHAV